MNTKIFGVISRTRLFAPLDRITKGELLALVASEMLTSKIRSAGVSIGG
ncbi:hypothetical protein [Streptococcus intermedius]|nr:hypothetical protein [Streptococcus intermedius]